jgi:hypothetical protein
MEVKLAQAQGRAESEFYKKMKHKGQRDRLVKVAKDALNFLDEIPTYPEGEPNPYAENLRAVIEDIEEKG